MTAVDERTANTPADTPPTKHAATWCAVVIAGLTIVAAIGAPLVGHGVFLGVDILRTVAPWNSHASSTFAYVHGPVNDTVNFFAPDRELLRTAILYGHRIQLWNPYASGGTPLGSVPNDGLLSPLEWPMLLLGPGVGAAWSALLRLSLAAYGTFAFTRRIGLSPFASMCAGLVYSMSGFIIVWSNWPQANIAAWIPALFYAADVVCERRRATDIGLLAVVVAAIVLEGYPPLVVITAYVLLPFLAVRIWVRRRAVDDGGVRLWPRIRARLPDLAPLGAAVALGIGIAAFQLVPFGLRLGELNLAYRVTEVNDSSAPAGLLTTAFPWAIGNPARITVFTYFQGFSFIGAAAMVFAAIAIARGPLAAVGRAVYWYCIVTLAALALPLYAGTPGDALPFGNLAKRVMRGLPLMGEVPVDRLRGPFLFILTLLVGMGIERVVMPAAARRAFTPRSAYRRWLRGAAILVVLVVAALVARSEHHFFAITHDGGWIVANSVVAVLIGLGAIAAAVIIRRSRGGLRRWVMVAIPVLLAIEALTVTVDTYPRVANAAYFPPDAAITYLQHHLGHDRVATTGDVLFPSASSYYRLRMVNGHSFSPDSWNQLVYAVSPTSPRRPNITVLGSDLASARSHVLDQLATRYLVTDPKAAPFGVADLVRNAPATTSIDAGATSTGSIAGEPVRAVVLPTRSSSRFDGSLDSIDVTMRGPSGEVLARGERRVTERDLSTAFSIVLAADRLPPTDERWSVAIQLRGAPGDHLDLAATEAGEPAIGVIRPQNDGLTVAFTDAGAVVWQRLHALPRIRWASNTITQTNQTRRLADLVYGVTANTVVLNQPGPRASGATGMVHTTRDSDDAIDVTVDARGAGYVVVADALQDGWDATVDGHAASLRPADNALVAVWVPAGHHTIALRAQPRGWRLGIAMTVVSLLATLALFGYAAATTHRRRRAISSAS
ncbi:MAG TPA: YfhO family protein [Acidimicrobiia bacterium]|jgi:hypothetical protein